MKHNLGFIGTFFELVSQCIIPPTNQELSNTTLTNQNKTKEEKSENIISFSANYHSEELQSQKPSLIKKKSSKYKQMVPQWKIKSGSVE